MMQNKRIYVITGSIGAGKSTFSKLLKDKGFFIIDSDKITHRLYEKQEIIRILVDEFGDKILKNGKINRKILGKIVFADKDKKKILESVVHPKVIDEIYSDIKSAKDNIIFIEIPLYSEVENELLDRVKNYKLIFVSAKKEVQVERIMNRNNISKEEALILIKNMKDYMVFSKKIDYIIMNNKDIVFLEKLVNEFIMNERLNESN